VKNSKEQKKPKPITPDGLPLKPVLDELAFVRKCFRDAAAHYTAQVEGELEALRESVATTATRKKVSASCAHGLREILMLLRSLEVKPEKGRRRDLKKIESLVKELRRITDSWE
jgi:hypothetical protein